MQHSNILVSGYGKNSVFGTVFLEKGMREDNFMAMGCFMGCFMG